MSSREQAAAYLEEAQLTLDSARAIFEAAETGQSDMWAQVVKNGYDAIEQAISAGIAGSGTRIPRQHPEKVAEFLDSYDPGDELHDSILHWLRRRSESQYVDIRGERINIPHEQFDRRDAERILADAESTITFVETVLPLDENQSN